MWYNLIVKNKGNIDFCIQTPIRERGAVTMNDKNLSAASSAELKKLFQSPKNIYKPYIFLPIDGKNDLDSPEKLSKLIGGYKKSGFGGIVPFSHKSYSVRPLSEEYYEIYRYVAKEAKASSLAVGYLDDTYIMREYISHLDEDKKKNAVCNILVKYDYACTEGQKLNRKLRSAEDLMSLVAVNDDDLTIVDLRGYIKDGEILEWTVPDGNWNIEEYICEPDMESNYVDLMDYEISSDYLKHTFRALLEQLDEKNGEVPPVNVFIYRNILYAGKNRRMWHRDFNKMFEEQFGIDPAPYYPLLFRDFGGFAKRYKSMLMTCRAKMLTEGYMKAAADFCLAHDILCTGYPAEGKAVACSWLFGDGQMLHKYATAPGLSMPFAYLYGLNGIRVAAGAADQLGAETVTADLFKYFSLLNRDIIYRESMNAYVRGVNMVFAHLGEDRTDEKQQPDETEPITWGSIFSKGDDLADFSEFATRVQTLLRGGEHLSEAAILYPIHSLHSLSYLYQSDTVEDFEYPSTPDNADYMELMNNFLNYVGIDTTFLHPDTVINRAHAENGILYIPTDKGTMKFKLIILPSMSIISVKALRVVKKFFDEGGKVISTDNLPTSAFECTQNFDDPNTAIRTESAEDIEVREIMMHIFGKEIADFRTYQRYYKNSNENGGMAYFLPSNQTSADRTESVSANMLYQAVGKFDFAPDVYIDKMPRREFFGMMNYNLPDFMKIGLDKRLARGCSMNYIHKKYAGCDIYYITNTTGDEYKGNILFRGRHIPEEWNPYNGRIRRMAVEYVTFRGELYTKAELSIEASSCTFVVSQSGKKDVIWDLTGDEVVYEYFPKERI